MYFDLGRFGIVGLDMLLRYVFSLKYPRELGFAKVVILRHSHGVAAAFCAANAECRSK